MLRRLEVFIPPPDQPPPQGARAGQEPQSEPLYLEWRKPGQDFWPELREADERREKRDHLKKRMKEIDHELKKMENADLAAGKKSPSSPKDAGSPKAAEPTEEDEAKLERERVLRT